MKYICLVYHEEKALEALTVEEHEAIIGECISWVQDLAESGRHVFSAGLQSSLSASTIHNENGQLSVTDGPFAETKEVLGGFTIIEARDLNDAIRIASMMPAARVGKVEVRPVLEPGNPMVDPLDQKISEALMRIEGCEAFNGQAQQHNTDQAISKSLK